MNKIILLVLVSISTLSYSQKIKGEYDKKSDIVSVGGEELFKVVPKSVAGQLTNMHFSITNLDDQELIYLKFNTTIYYSNGKKMNKVWYDLMFIESGNKIQKFKSGTMGAKGAMKIILKNDLIKDSKIDPVSEQKLML